MQLVIAAGQRLVITDGASSRKILAAMIVGQSPQIPVSVIGSHPVNRRGAADELSMQCYRQICLDSGALLVEGETLAASMAR